MTVSSEIICCSCGGSSPKYKCPSCRSPYCSSNCCREHKTNGCTPAPSPIPPPAPPADNRQFPTEDTLPLEKLHMLKESSAVRKCLENPHLRHIMEAIDKSKCPSDLIAQAMLEPIFTEFATECLKVVQPNEFSEIE